jgi:hypothetical protein
MNITDESSALRTRLLAMMRCNVALEWSADGWRALIDGKWVAVEDDQYVETQNGLHGSTCEELVKTTVVAPEGGGVTDLRTTPRDDSTFTQAKSLAASFRSGGSQR